MTKGFIEEIYTMDPLRSPDTEILEVARILSDICGASCISGSAPLSTYIKKPISGDDLNNIPIIK